MLGDRRGLGPPDAQGAIAVEVAAALAARQVNARTTGLRPPSKQTSKALETADLAKYKGKQAPGPPVRKANCDHPPPGVRLRPKCARNGRHGHGSGRGLPARLAAAVSPRASPTRRAWTPAGHVAARQPSAAWLRETARPLPRRVPRPVAAPPRRRPRGALRRPRPRLVLAVVGLVAPRRLPLTRWRRVGRCSVRASAGGDCPV